jgi:hypothetical protein
MKTTTWPADKVERRPLATIIPYAKNARTHTEEQVKQIAASMREWGWTNPVLIDEAGTIIAGHGRILAAQVLGLTEAPVMVANGWTESQKRAYTIADNKLGLNAVWDDSMLSLELTDLHGLGFDLSKIGFGPDELIDLIGTPNTGVDPDEVPAAPVVPISRTGDLWLLGSHRLLCGDSTKADDVARLMGGAKVALCLTDPPYGIDVVSRKSGKLGGEGGPTPYGGTRNAGTIGGAKAYGKTGGKLIAAREYMPIIGDDKPFDPLPLLDLAAEQIIFGANYFASKLPDGKSWIVWDKDASGNFSAVELAWTSHEGHLRMYRHMWSGLRREGTREVELNARVHPTQKPVGLFAAILEDFSADGDVVIDPYLGSGTTLIACEKLGRSCYALEIAAIYCDISILRLQTYTGKQATLDADGRTFAEVKAERCETEAIA